MDPHTFAPRAEIRYSIARTRVLYKLEHIRDWEQQNCSASVFNSVSLVSSDGASGYSSDNSDLTHYCAELIRFELDMANMSRRLPNYSLLV